MESQSIEIRIEEINKKLDFILEEIELQKKHRREMDDLKDDLMRVGKDIYDSAVVELEEVHDHLQTGDMLHLGKKLLRNVNNISKMFDQLESVRDFLGDTAPIFRQSTIDLMNLLDEFDKKGYFQFIKEVKGIADNIVNSFTSEDVKQLGDNIVTILNTVKNFTQPDMLEAINNAVSVYKNLNVEVEKDITLLHLIGELRKPEVKRGIAFSLNFLIKLSEANSNKAQHINN